MTILASLPVCYMDFQVFRTGNYLEIARRVVERITVDVVNVLFGRQFAVKEPFHDDAMFRLVMPIPSPDIAIPILNVLAGEYPRANRLSISTHEGVMILTKTLCQCRQLAIFNRAGGILVAIWLLCQAWIAIVVPATVVHTAHTTAYARFTAVIYRAIRFLFWHRTSIAQARL